MKKHSVPALDGRQALSRVDREFKNVVEFTKINVGEEQILKVNKYRT